MICIVYIDRNFQRPIGYVCILYFMNCKPELLCAAQPPHNVRLHNLQRIYAICPLLYNVQYTDIHTHCEAVNHLPYSMNQTLRSSENLFARAALERINRPEYDKDLSLSLSASHIIRILNCVQCGNVSRCPAHSPVTMRTRIFQHLLPADQLTFAMCSMASRKSDVYRKRIVSIRRCSHETGQE